MSDISDTSRNGADRAEATRSGPVLIPATDIIETGDQLLMLLDMPGADPETLDVTLDQRILSVSAQSAATALQGYAPIYGEYREGAYERKFIVNDQINGDRIAAVLKDGVLRITLPKAAPSPAKKISVALN